MKTNLFSHQQPLLVRGSAGIGEVEGVAGGEVLDHGASVADTAARWAVEVHRLRGIPGDERGEMRSSGAGAE